MTTPSSCPGDGQVMPLVIVVLFVGLPHFLVELENHVAVVQAQTHPAGLQEDRST